MRASLFLVLLCALLNGCGQKGPLFIPDDSSAPAPASAPAATTPAPAATSQP